ncbi:hypothetical protein T12_5382, partial [Trichinella patagoniensis]
LLSQSSSVRTHPDNELVLVAVSAFRIYGLRHSMKLVPLATLVHMHIGLEDASVTWIELDNIYNDR